MLFTRGVGVVEASTLIAPTDVFRENDAQLDHTMSDVLHQLVSNRTVTRHVLQSISKGSGDLSQHEASGNAGGSSSLESFPRSPHARTARRSFNVWRLVNP